MSRVIKIEKVGESTILELKENDLSSVEVFVFNKDTNVTLRNNVISIESTENRRLSFQFEEIEDKLLASNAIDYLYKMSMIRLFNH